MERETPEEYILTQTHGFIAKCCKHMAEKYGSEYIYPKVAKMVSKVIKEALENF